MNSRHAQYVIISPMRDESEYVEQTLRSVCEQTVKPMLWIIVDDGSRDHSRDIVAQYAAKYSWIKLHSTSDASRRQPGSNVVRTFNEGFELTRGLPFDFVVKLDCDVHLPPAYFEQLLEQFSQDEKLGIASGVYEEQGSRGWREVEMPAYHAAGASKMIRTSCFTEIGGFVPSRGWDTVDEIRARVKGWDTKHFQHVKFDHLKPEGTGIGFLRTSVMHGEIYYLTGGSGLFLIFKALHRAWAGRPPVLAALAMLFGYLKKLLGGSTRLVSNQEAEYYKSLLNQRLLTPFGLQAPSLAIPTRSHS